VAGGLLLEFWYPKKNQPDIGDSCNFLPQPLPAGIRLHFSERFDPFVLVHQWKMNVF